MIEELFQMTLGDSHTIERIIADDNIHYNHMILEKDQGLPEHDTNSTVYMTVLRGRLSIALAHQEAQEYEAGSILKLPKGVRMKVLNKYEDILELIVIKAPAPGK
ncbi:MAG: cupin domain-containing protein [Tissierellia bacterium]|nr:cupin domain-containing protein [Tissierellia bacterium]